MKLQHIHYPFLLAVVMVATTVMASPASAQGIENTLTLELAMTQVTVRPLSEVVNVPVTVRACRDAVTAGSSTTVEIAVVNAPGFALVSFAPADVVIRSQPGGGCTEGATVMQVVVVPDAPAFLPGDVLITGRYGDAFGATVTADATVSVQATYVPGLTATMEPPRAARVAAGDTVGIPIRVESLANGPTLFTVSRVGHLPDGLEVRLPQPFVLPAEAGEHMEHDGGLASHVFRVLVVNDGPVSTHAGEHELTFVVTAAYREAPDQHPKAMAEVSTEVLQAWGVPGPQSIVAFALFAATALAMQREKVRDRR